MKFLYLQQYERPGRSSHKFHAALFIFFNLIIALDFAQGSIRVEINLSKITGTAKESATARKAMGTEDSIPFLGNEPHKYSSEHLKGNPNFPHKEDLEPSPHESPDPNEKRSLFSLISRFFKWLLTRKAAPKFGGLKLPIKDHLKEPMTGIWHRSPAFRYSPRPPTDKNEEEMTTLEMLGKELSQKDEGLVEEAKKKWDSELEELGAVTLRRKVLSTELFFQLVKNYRKQAVSATQYQKSIKKMGENLVKAFGGEAALKKLFQDIESNFKELNKGMIGTKYDPDFYKKPLSPLLLLTGKESEGLHNLLAQKNIATGYFEKGVKSKMDYLTQEAEKYRLYVQHFKETTDTQNALRHYLEEVQKLNMAHEPYEKAVLEHFEKLDITKKDDALEKIIESGADVNAMREMLSGPHQAL